MSGEHLLLYDGDCGLCSRVVQFVLPRDRRARFRFAALQGDTARALLSRYGKNPDALDTVYAVVDAGTPSERLLDRSDAGLFVLEQLGGAWRLAAPLWLVPRVVRDAVYRYIARNRIAWFGRADACTLPAPEHRARFVEVPVRRAELERSS